MIETSCPSCGKAYRLKPELAGRKARCRNCSAMFLVPDDDFDDLAMESVAIESYRPPLRTEPRLAHSVPAIGIDFSTGDEADKDDDFDSDPASSRPRPVNRPPAWNPGKRRTSQGLRIPSWFIAGVFAAIAFAALFFFFVLPWIKGPSIAEITGLDEAVAAQFELADDPPIGTPAPADMRPVEGPPIRDLSGNQLVFEDLIGLMDEFRQKLTEVKDFGTFMVAVDWVEKSLKPRALELNEEQRSLPSVLTKKENSLMRDHYLRFVKVFDQVLAEYERIRKIPDAADFLSDLSYFNQLHSFKEMIEKEFRNMDPVVDTRPEGDPAKYAELRVVGTDTPEMKACFEARLFTRHPIKYIKIHQNGSAPTRYSVWPIDDVAAFARGIEAGRVVHVTGREVWVVVEPLSAAEAERERVKAVEYRKKYILDGAGRIRQLRESRGRIRQEIARSLENPSGKQPELAEAPAVAEAPVEPRSPRMQRSEELRRRMMRGERMPGIPASTGGAAAGLQPVMGAEERGRPLTGVTVGNGGGSGGVTAMASKADTEQVAKVSGQKDAFAIALERIKEPHHQENVEFGMAILLKIDLKGRETELYEALGPYLDSPNEDNAAIALAILDRLDDPRRVDEVLLRLDKNRQTAEIFCGILVKWKDPRAIEPLASQLDGFPLWKHFDKALIAFGPAAEKAVIAKLASPEEDARKRACEILGQIGGDESLKVFAKLKPDSDPFVRMAANAAITNIRSRLGIPAGRRAAR